MALLQQRRIAGAGACTSRSVTPLRTVSRVSLRPHNRDISTAASKVRCVLAAVEDQLWAVGSEICVLAEFYEL
jgi:hypothetical protein